MLVYKSCCGWNCLAWQSNNQLRETHCSEHTQLSDEVISQETMKLAQSPAGIGPRSSEPKPDTLSTELFSLTVEKILCTTYNTTTTANIN